MGLRSALGQVWYVTLPVIAFLGWIALKALAVYDGVAAAGAASADARGDLVGQAFASGVVGLFVLLTVAVLFVVLYSELGEASPGPAPWPPEE